MTSVAVIGAGLSGLVVARQLRDHADVTVFEKSRGPGGRIATRYADEFEFDHGAQFFTARSADFRAFLHAFVERGVIADWQATFAEFDRDRMATLRDWSDEYPHFVGTPRMNSFGQALAENLSIVYTTEISAVRHTSAGWSLSTSTGEDSGPFDWVVVTAPAAQTAALADASPDLVVFSRERPMLGCFAMMLGLDAPLELEWQAALVRNADISWMSVNSSKPGRGRLPTLVVHSTNAWADTHIDDDTDDVLEHLLAETSEIIGGSLRPVHKQVQRWRYANINKQSGPAFFLDPGLRIAACGDWCVRGRIEAAFESANELAKSLVERI